MKKISVVIPVYNEETAIVGNIQRVVAALEGLSRDWELVLVNDGSTDGTLARMKSATEANPHIRLVSYDRNRGRGFAMKTGFKNASGDYIITTESDLNWGSEIIGRFAAELDKDDADIIIASPHMKGGSMENVPFLRWLLSYAGNLIFSFAFPGSFTMVTGMTRGYRREVLDTLDLEANDKELHVEILYKAIDLGYRAREIPAVLRWQKAAPGVVVRKSHFKIGQIVKHLMLSFLIRPFLLFGIIGISMLVVGAVLGLYLLGVSLAGMPVAGRPMLFASVLFIIIGLQILLFGFLANQNRDLKRQLVRIYRNLYAKK